MSAKNEKPWRLAGPHLDGSNTIVAANGRIVCALMPHEATNGERIVHAVNAYDDMLKLAKDAMALDAEGYNIPAWLVDSAGDIVAMAEGASP